MKMTKIEKILSLSLVMLISFVSGRLFSFTKEDPSVILLIIFLAFSGFIMGFYYLVKEEQE